MPGPSPGPLVPSPHAPSVFLLLYWLLCQLIFTSVLAFSSQVSCTIQAIKPVWSCSFHRLHGDITLSIVLLPGVCLETTFFARFKPGILHQLSHSCTVPGSSREYSLISVTLPNCTYISKYPPLSGAVSFFLRYFHLFCTGRLEAPNKLPFTTLILASAQQLVPGPVGPKNRVCDKEKACVARQGLYYYFSRFCRVEISRVEARKVKGEKPRKLGISFLRA